MVCEEHKDVLLDAWDKEQEQRIKREQEVRLKTLKLWVVAS